MERALTRCVLLAFVIGCGTQPFQPTLNDVSDGAAVRIAVPSVVQAGEEQIELSVHNLGSVQYTWNPCLRVVERRTGSQWSTVQEDEHVCTLEGWILEPDQQTRATTGLPQFLAQGEYRLRYCFHRRSRGTMVCDQQLSTSFTVAP
jgi:hypothetical protein